LPGSVLYQQNACGLNANLNPILRKILAIIFIYELNKLIKKKDFLSNEKFMLVL